ncbi:hypothetical protein [uncultured Alsobacter sp.]|uniref:hypothetical protein n=1 Tax=uncultured Alsobacter sp. TaxID=1748258 RepID=UPI0025E32978|nr:hypothetical protein [uncultured Alsobacter sp.]
MNRDAWKAFSRQCRTDAARRLGYGQAATFGYGFERDGVPFTLSVYRSRAMSWQHKARAHGEPVTVRTSCLADRPRRALSFDALAWAARYRRNAVRDRRDPHRLRYSAQACRATVEESRGYESAFARLP